MNITNFGKAENKDYSFNINIDFTTKTELTPRMIEVSEAFGLGVSEEKHFVIYKDFNIGFNQGDVVFITGDSGGGKSLLLKELNNHQDIIHKINLDDIQPDPEEVIIESVGKTLEEGIRILSLMGLNDAFIFLRKYKELSDGQKYRYRLAKALSMKPDFLFIDEFCFDKSTKIYTDNGIKNINKIKIGDSILSSNGKYEKVLLPMNRPSILNKKIRINYKNEYVKCTNNHPFLVKSSGLKMNDSKGRIQYLRKKSIHNNAQWLPANNIEIGDMLFFPKPIVKKIDTIKISDYISNYNIKNDFIYYGKNINPNSLDIPNTIPINKDFSRLLGYYVAEGSQGPRFSFNKDEKEYVNFIEKTMKKIFNISPSYKNKNNSTYIISYHSKVLTEFFETVCGHTAINKKIPEFIMNSTIENSIEFIKGWYNGDGSFLQSQGTTISKTLAEQLFLLGLKCNVIISVNKHDRKQNSFINGRELKSCGYSYSSKLSSTDKKIADYLKIKQVNKYRHGYFDNDGFWTYVLNIENIEEKTTVYNLSVENTHDYVTSIGVAHNCANLDRTTAKVISYNLQRTARREKMSLIVATTHRDIAFDLNPDVVIDKKFMDEVELTYNDTKKREISFRDQVYIEEGTLTDYKKLAKYHYKNTSHNFPYSKIYVAKRHEELVGVAVYSPPFLQTKGRSIYFDKKYSHMTKEVVADINKFFIRRSRSIISPKYRACGLGKMLAMESMLKIKDKKYIEAINVMGKYTPVNKQIGMTEVTIGEETDGPTIKLDKWMKEKGLKVEEIHNPKYFDLFISSMTDEDRLTLVRLTGKVLHHPKVGLSSKDGRRAEVVAQEKRYAKTTFEDVYEELLVTIPKLYSGVTLYYVWENPNYKEPVKQGLGAYLK